MSAVVLAGCGYLGDPYQRPGTYRPTSDNDANLRVMVVNPADLVEGTGSGVPTGGEAAPPVARLLAGKRYPLPDLNAATVNVTNEPASQQGSANPGSAQ
ncbi:MAG TPA: hypothetical protein VH855_08485 [Acetobacteraceae bacterium]|jgi:hypothetical protein